MTPTDSQAPAAPAAPAAAAPDVTDYQRQIDELKEQVAESQRTAQFWADKAANGAHAAAASAPAVDEEEPDVLEAITTGGAKGFDQLAKKRGFIQRNEVEQIIEARATSLTKEQQLMKEYPDLENKDTEFFKTTAENYGRLVKSGTPQPVAMEMAARQAELQFIRAGKIKVNGSGRPSGDEKEAARLKRIAAQASPSGSARPAPVDEEDEELTPQQKHIADAMGISHEAYAKRAKTGVAMRGVK
jgi:hypothetical protein